MLLLTVGPNLYYVDPSNMVVKGQIPFGMTLRAEAKNFKNFHVHTVMITQVIHFQFLLQYITNLSKQNFLLF